MENRHPASYRDPSGFIFLRDTVIYRQVNRSFADDFDAFLQSGCYQNLVNKKLLLSHDDVSGDLDQGDAYRILKPVQLPFISYPYEWSFQMLKDAALLTLQITREAITHGMILKDASAYNIQWLDGKPIFIDTLSFERYNETEPWIAYRQFCEHFLGPLLLMHYRKQALQPLLIAWPDGVPLGVCSSLLPGRSRYSLHTYLHIHLHAKISGKASGAGSSNQRKVVLSRQKLLNLLSSLGSLIGKLKLERQRTNWSEYYDEASTRGNYLHEKQLIIGQWLKECPGVETVADMGANEGAFSKLAAQCGYFTIAADLDPFCIDELYRSFQSEGIKKIQPLIADLGNPSPSIGLNNKERASLLQRIHTDLVLALALIHHLAIGRNIQLSEIVHLFSGLSKKYLVIEWVPKSDEKVQFMLQNKKDIYPEYNEAAFVAAFNSRFTVKEKRQVGDSGRVLYLLKKNES